MVVKPATPLKVVGTTSVETMVLEAKDTDVDVLVKVTSEEPDEVPVGGVRNDVLKDATQH
jgi:hypothetical protein